MTITEGDTRHLMRGWPAALVRIAEVTSTAAALKLVDAFGGTSIYVPQSITSEDRLALILGAEAAVALAEAFGGDRLDIPTMAFARHRKAMIIQAEGSARVVARRLGVTERYVRMVRNAGSTHDPRQIDWVADFAANDD